MEKPVLIVSTSSDIYGSYAAALTEIESAVSRVFSSPYGKEMEQQVCQWLVEHPEVSTILSRGVWYNRLKGLPFIRNHPYIRVELLTTDDRTSLREFIEIQRSGFERICLIVIGSADDQRIAEEKYRILGDSFVKTLMVYDADAYEEDVRQMIRDESPDVLWGDVDDLSDPEILKLPRYQSTVRGYTMQMMIRNALDYHRARMEQQHNERIRNYLSSLTRVMEELLFLVDDNGVIIRCNDNRIITELGGQAIIGHNISEYLNIPFSTLLEQRENNYVQFRKNRYIANLISYRWTEVKYALILNSVDRISAYDAAVRKHTAQHKFPARYTFQDIVAVAKTSINSVNTARSYAHHDATVLITGETGTGKELYASSIHNESNRSSFPFVALNCAAFSESLIESELFGYEKGSFTGALSGGKIGLFEAAHRGTVFLDEISELPMHLQSKLLRVLQEKVIMRIGGREIIHVDVRVIAATNKNLLEMCEKGQFRYDLYYRLALLELPIAPLRERKEDILPLFLHYFKRANADSPQKRRLTNPDQLQCLYSYSWHGNVRELRNTVLRSIIITEETYVTPQDVERAMPVASRVEAGEGEPVPYSGKGGFSFDPQGDLESLERAYIAFVLNRFGGNKERTCAYLGISKATLWRKLKHTPADET